MSPNTFLPYTHDMRRKHWSCLPPQHVCVIDTHHLGPNTCLCLSRLSSCLAHTAPHVSLLASHALPLTSLHAHFIVRYTSSCGWLRGTSKALVATIAKHAAVPLNLVQIDKVECDNATGRVLVSVSLKVVRPPLFSSMLPCLRLPWSLHGCGAWMSC